MRTVFAIAKVEFSLLLRDKRFLGAGIGLWVMLGLLLAVAQSRFVSEQKQVAAAQQTARHQWKTRTSGGGHALGHYGTYVYRKATPLSMMHPGGEPYVGVAAHIVAHKQTNMFFRPMLDRAAIDRWAEASATTLLQVVVPLLLLLLAFAAIAGDREDGRLRFLLGQGASPVAFALGKLLGVAAVAAVLLVPAALIIAVLVGQAGSALDGSALGANALSGSADLGGRLLVLAAGYGALYVFFLALGIALSTLSATRQSALLFCVGVWAALCLIAPRTLTTFAENRFPTPDVDVLQERIDTERKDIKVMRALRERVLEDALRRYKVRREEELPVRLDALQLQAGEEFVNSINDKHMGQVWSQFTAQEQWVSRTGSFLTPTVSLRGLSETVSGTDAATLRAHVAAIEEFRRDWVRRLNEADATRPRRRRTARRGEGARAQEASHHQDTSTKHNAEEASSQEKANQAKWAAFPPFNHEPPSLSSLRPQTTSNLLVLWGWAGIAVLAAIFCVQFKSGANRGLN